ncbi:MAG TPA: DNA gyrase subunit A [Armatimonadetes bacterium]|nr:DNA gyrase subunit A [Armatimonadota bacterium]
MAEEREQVARRVFVVELERELRQSFLDYAMSVITARALPDVRDGLKPVQRRTLYAMLEANLTPERPHRKSAVVVGDVLGKYHPHGDAPVYEALVRMAQDFSMRYPLVDGQGNFGSIDGDPPAAMRYTEVRLSPLAMEMLQDIEKDTVDFVPNYDDTRKEPTVLPSKLPNLLVNGSSGIAVGMATSIPPHNLREVCKALVAMIDNPNITLDEVMRYLPGPDFPTGGVILGTKGIKEAYRRGRGHIVIQAKAAIEPLPGGRSAIVVTELPYQVNKADLVKHIADLVRTKKIEGIADLRDESGRGGIRIVIELRRDAKPEVVLEQLYRHTQMRTTFSVIMLALVGGKGASPGTPKVLPLLDLMRLYLDHRREVVRRRSEFELKNCRERAHIVEGFLKALSVLDEVIRTIRASESPEEAKVNLMRGFGFTERQARAILDMRLQRLTRLEREKLEAEHKELTERIRQLEALLAQPRMIDEVIKAELLELMERYGDERRTLISEVEPEELKSVEELLAEERMVVVISRDGRAKRVPLSAYKAEEKVAAREAGAALVLIAGAQDYLLLFTNKGRVYAPRVYDVPAGTRQSAGSPLSDFTSISRDERVVGAVAVRGFEEEKFVVLATRRGLVKRMSLPELFTKRSAGAQAILLQEEDEVVASCLTSGEDEVIIGTRFGMAIRFRESDIRPMGRAASGVRGVSLLEGDEVVGMEVARPGAFALTVSERGFGKRTPLDGQSPNERFPLQGRGGKGVVAMKVTERTGRMVALRLVEEDDEVLIATGSGLALRVEASRIPTQGRNTQGSRLLRLSPTDKVTNVVVLTLREEKS